MYELFLTAFVEDEDLSAACSVLSGLCGMPAWESLSRVLYFQGTGRPSGISNQSSIERPLRKDVGLLWKDLHQSLSRQSFVLQARYEVVKDRDMGSAAQPMELDSTSGVLRWTDFPEPPQGRPIMAQRKKVEIWEQKKLPSILRDNNYQFKTETVEEMLRFFRDEVEFTLTRHYFIQPITAYTPLNAKPQPTIPLSTLPAHEDLTPVDSQRRWVLQVKTHVMQDTRPDEVRRAQDALFAVRSELEGVFDFQIVDRKVHDTRVAQQAQGVQALPQRVTLGTK